MAHCSRPYGKDTRIVRRKKSGASKSFRPLPILECLQGRVNSLGLAKLYNIVGLWPIVVFTSFLESGPGMGMGEE